jgi:DNA-binding protein H-NS
MSTYAEIQAQIQRLQQEAEDIRIKELSDVISNLKAQIAKFNLTAKDLGLSFEQFKNGVKEKYSTSIESDYSKWSKFSDLSPGDAYKMLNILKKGSLA